MYLYRPPMKIPECSEKYGHGKILEISSGFQSVPQNSVHGGANSSRGQTQGTTTLNALFVTPFWPWEPCWVPTPSAPVPGITRCTQIVLNSRVPIVEKVASVVMDALGDLVLKVS